MTTTAFIIVFVLLVSTNYLFYRWGRTQGAVATMKAFIDALDKAINSATVEVEEQEDQCSQ